jgi:TolB-like protein/class 3 adenylate cyclase/Tfp pilus assembly protein PilF
MATEVKKEIELEIAHVLFIDIVGYSKLLVDQQRKLLELLNHIVRSSEQVAKAEANNRLIMIPTGDGMALVFYNTPEAPVECALEISRAVKRHPELKLRMGVHSGAVSGVIDVSGRANIAGAGINVAQRVMDCGDAGHILLSKHVAEDLEQLGHWHRTLHDLGECEVKHGQRVSVVNLYTEELGNPEVPQKFLHARHKAAAAPVVREKKSRAWMIPVSLLLVTALVLGAVLLLRRSGSFGPFAPEKSVAVLPFANLSEDKANAYFADGIQDEILTRLSKIADLKVISRTSTEHYKSAPENLRDIAKQLGVANILEGSVQKSNDAVRVNVQLIKAANDSHLWADTFDRKLTDIFSVESEIAKSIADQLRAKLTGQEEQAITEKPTNSPEAYDAYLRGLVYNNKLSSPTNALGAQKYLREAVRLDPKFAVAWARLSQAEAKGYVTLNISPTVSLREEARSSAETALDLQPSLGEALLAKGVYHYSCLKDYDAALRYFEQAQRALPNSSEILMYRAFVARRRGAWDRSEAYFKEAERIDPRNVSLLTEFGGLYTLRRQFPQALQKCEQVLQITPEDHDIVTRLAGIAQAQGDLPRAATLLAPIQPGLSDTGTVETQVYQKILERKAGEIVPYLIELLRHPDASLGYNIGETRFYLGWALDCAGDHAAAQATWRSARQELEAFVNDQPDNYQLFADLALACAGLHDKPAALEFAKRCAAVIPMEKDALEAPMAFEILARVCAQVDEPNRSIAALEKVLSVPYEGALASDTPVTPAILRLDPMFDSLRNDPAFQKLCEEKPK